MPNHKKKILIIEDEAMISLMYCTEFARNGYIILTADNGIKGLEMAVKEKPDIIVLDIVMPELDGFSVLEKLRVNKTTKDIPVIILTVLGGEENRLRGEKLGAVEYIVKSDFTPAQIYKIIKKYVG